MGYKQGCFRVRHLCRFGCVAAMVAAEALFVACGGDSGSGAGYDFEIVGDSSSGLSLPDLGDSSEVQPLSSSGISSAIASLSSSAMEPSLSSTVEPPKSSAVEPPRSSSGMEPPRSSDSRPPHSSSAHNPPPSSETVPPPSSASEPLLDFGFYTGADISTVQEYERFGAKFFDVDGTEKDIFTLLKDHGFNAIRLKTFVSPKAKYGYAAAGCEHDAEAYADKDHIVAYAKKIKAAGMAFLLDIHYSDNWADPGKQIIPERWRKVNSSDALADSVYAYTLDLMNALKQVNAVPEMVQIGNETTPGILIHVPNNKTDCWGNNVDKASTAINGDMGTSSGKANAAKYFKAGIKAVKEVSPSTKTVLHIERIRQANTVTWWMTEIFKNQKVPADVMGFSAYTAYGDKAPDDWKSLFQTVTSSYPNLEFIVAEYNGGDADNHYNFDGSRKRTTEMVKGLDRWIGTFFWEPTLGGAWGPALFDWKGSNLQANSKAFEEFPMR
ncbi:glycosyl hydrolase 53 family protein [Fibrobacter sp. UWR2]|uniref:glycosyl hydrolase 53 family protein n=1 Tax=Fibrobacter sp. UWR2 TaxID=1964352 RepID=UPI000B51FEDE|nr:glycosyl hydrolase 53 family protein [Fibrobacter sp. UWR2]OWV02336.1 arabinogalactan endo-1,4-beta-galactosidase [Fibrobacter sp. UWR2]